MTKATWDERIQRAGELTTTYPFAAEVLRFYSQITSFQKDLYGYIVSVCGSRMERREGGSLRDELDLFILLPKFSAFLSLVERTGTPSLAEAARELTGEGSGRWQELLAANWGASGEGKPPAGETELFCARAFLQPYAEYLADHTELPPITKVRPVCPLCQGRPQVGVLRQEGDGGKRSLICASCLTEWEYRRIVCPACEEENVEKLGVYTASEIPHVRVEACDTCKTYIKTVDLTKNGHAVPVVDELATIPLTLWAEEKGYAKLQPNLLGI